MATSSSSSTTTSMAKSTKPNRTSSSSSSVSSSSTVSQNAGAASSSTSRAATTNANANTASQASQGVQNQAPQASANTATTTNQSTVASQTQKASNAREKGVLALTKGDYSNAAGEWTDAKGNVITIDPAGTVTVQKSGEEPQSYNVAGYSYTLDDGQFRAQLSGGSNIQITTGNDGSVTAVQVMP